MTGICGPGSGRARILAYLQRQRVITVDPDADLLSVSDELAERDPALADAAAKSRTLG